VGAVLQVLAAVGGLSNIDNTQNVFGSEIACRARHKLEVRDLGLGPEPSARKIM
jgi:hypothetical protein